MLIVGIDPGLTGALAFITDAGYLQNVWDIPTFELTRGGRKKRAIDELTLVSILTEASPAHAFLESVHSMPKQGVASVFSLGDTFGTIKGILSALGIPRTMVEPTVWKKALQVPAAKDGARYRASELLPGGAECWPLVKHDGRAEAALIAVYGLRTFREIIIGQLVTGPVSVD